MIRVWYHANCLDGFGAAYVLWLNHQVGFVRGPIEFQPVAYGEPVPFTNPGDQVWIVDFSWPRILLEELAWNLGARGCLTVIDHHKTAAADLEGFPGATFDTEKSGAVLTWEHVFPDQPVPMLLRYIQDADLWRWELDGSREFRQGLWCEPRDFEHWDGLSAGGMDSVFGSGLAILRHVELEVERIAAKASRAILDGFDVLLANSDGMASKIGHELAQRSDSGIGVVWHLDGETYRWQLRSTPDGPDVSLIAKKCGGGGHEHAAGFQTPYFQEVFNS
jgi:oligoribonuclease NrnB/cAMP/cGMP phosphodiesterase (DHH superfamily)